MTYTRRALQLAAVFALGLGAISAHGQACALCHTQAAAETARFIAALRSGIMILIVPSARVAGAMGGLAYYKRDHFNEGDSEQSDSW